jgi:hypothetical protein
MALPALLDAQEQISMAIGEPIAINLQAKTCLNDLEKICAALRILAPDEALTAGFDRHVACLNFEGKIQSLGSQYCCLSERVAPNISPVPTSRCA